MLFDHVPFRVIQLKVAVGIAQGRSGVPKPVQPVRGVGRVPIVEEIIVQQSAFWVMILMYLWKNTGYSVILLLAGLVTVPAEQYESADLDGASAFQKFRYITTPQMWYSVFFALIFSVINAFKCFREIFLIGGEHPVDELYMLQHFINNCFSNLNYQKLSVASVLLLIVIIVFFGLFYAFVSRKEAFRE